MCPSWYVFCVEFAQLLEYLGMWEGCLVWFVVFVCLLLDLGILQSLLFSQLLHHAFFVWHIRKGLRPSVIVLQILEVVNFVSIFSLLSLVGSSYCSVFNFTDSLLYPLHFVDEFIH